MNETDVFNALKYRTYNADMKAYEWRNSDGELHRVGGPAVEYDNGTKEWWQNSEPHRTDGPAIEWYDGDKWWHQNGQCHRTDGPAIERANGSRVWYINGEELTEEQFKQRTK